MNYIIMAAGIGSRLHPYTKTFPKSVIRVRDDITVIERTIAIIREMDINAEVTLVVGYMCDDVVSEVDHLGIDNVVLNPFYKVTNSIASMWLARDFLKNDVIIINGDVVLERSLFEEIIKSNESFVAYDSSMHTDIDYAVQLDDEGYITVMGKNLRNNNGEFVGLIKLNGNSADSLRCEIEHIVAENFDTWYETALVQMILTRDFKIKGRDFCDYQWTELDSIDDVFKAREICSKDL